MVAAIAAACAVIFGITTWLVALLNIREKLWPKPPKPHPLEASLRDVATAVRELRQR